MHASDGDGNNPWQNNHPWQNSPPDTNQQQRKGKGRQKVAMEKIENETNLQVTFSKRRAGAFKKASEICILCGAQAAVVVFSPGGKAHSFGNPSVETVTNRFLNINVPVGGVDPLLAAHNEAIIRQRNQEQVSAEAQLEQEQQRKNDLEEARKALRSQNVFPPRLDKLSYEQLEQLKKSISGYRRQFEAKLKKVVTIKRAHPEEDLGGGVQWAPSVRPTIGPSNQFPHYDYGSSNLMAFDVGPGSGSNNPMEFDVGPSGGSSDPMGFGVGPGGGSSNLMSFDYGSVGGSSNPIGFGYGLGSGSSNPIGFDYGPGGGSSNPMVGPSGGSSDPMSFGVGPGGSSNPMGFGIGPGGGSSNSMGFDYRPGGRSSNPMGFGYGPGSGSSNPMGFDYGPGGGSSNPMGFDNVPSGSSNPMGFSARPGGSSNPMGFGVGPGGSSSSFAPSSNANVDQHRYIVQYPHMAGRSGSDYMVPYNYGPGQPYNYMQDPGSVPPYDMVPFGGGTSSSNVEGGGSDSLETQFNIHNNFQGFNNFGPKDC